MEIEKSKRYSKILGNYAEYLVCKWLARSGFEVVLVDHTGIDIIAYSKTLNKRLGITVKARTRTPGKEEDSVNLLKRQNGKNDRMRVEEACTAFACEPWIAVYVETSDYANLYLTSLENYDRKYRTKEGKIIDDWKMSIRHQQDYTNDPLIKHIQINFSSQHWFEMQPIEDDQENTDQEETG